MKTIQSITVVEDVTLISLQDSPADIAIIDKIFSMISDAKIDVDMISQTPHGRSASLSFTVKGDDFGKILEIAASMREINPDLKLNVSSGNCKISVFGEEMRGLPGVAAKVFHALAQTHTDIRMVTTSEVDISLLVPKADMDDALVQIQNTFA